MMRCEFCIETRPFLRGRLGFTLIELLVTITILIVITAIVYGSFNSVVDSTELAREAGEEARFRQFLSRSFMTNVSMAFAEPLGDLDLESTQYFEGVSGDGALGPQDILAFWCSSAPAATTLTCTPTTRPAGTRPKSPGERSPRTRPPPATTSRYIGSTS